MIPTACLSCGGGCKSRVTFFFGGSRPFVFHRVTPVVTSKHTAERRSLSRHMTSAKGASAQPGSATGASTPFATVNVSPFLWCVPPRGGARGRESPVP